MANRKNTRRANRKNTRRANRKNTRRANRRGTSGGMYPYCSDFIKQSCPGGGKHNRDIVVKGSIQALRVCSKCGAYCTNDF